MTNPTNPAWRNDDLEGAVIGAFFLRGADPEVMDILATLPADVFFVRQYRDIYAGICRQARVSGVIDPVLLCNEMPELAPVITDTGRKTWVKSSLEHYVAALRRNAALRDAEKTLNEALQKLRDAHTCEAAEDALKDAHNMMASLSTEKGVIQPVHIDDVLPEVVERVECRNQGLEKSRTLMTGIDELDAKTGGMEPGDLVFIAARPSMGKTELALDIIDKVTEQGHGVLLFTMEMANIQIGERMVSAAGGMPVSRLKSVARFEDEDWARFSQGVGRMTGRNIWMVDQANLTIDEICATTKHHLIK
ncbi:replicative DNA helicase, partial [Escherichia coli]|nr:replicative DNA helicase [Escherichia coli]EIV8367904.1 replicative DNA helicase [Escherichia coli]